MGKKPSNTTLIYIVDKNNNATKIQGDNAAAYELITTKALKLLEKHDPESFKVLQGIKTTRVRLLFRSVSPEEFKKIKQQREEDQS